MRALLFSLFLLAALAPARLPLAFGLVIGIEAVLEVVREQRIAGQVRAQKESLEEPRRMREVPLGRAGVVHGLDGLVLVAQGRGEIEGKPPGRGEPLLQRGCGVSSWAEPGGRR